MKLLLTLATVACMAIAGQSAIAQTDDYPSKPIHFMVPYPPGGGLDIMARRLASQLAPVSGQEIIVENRGGAGGSIAMQAAAEAEPDGYTMILAATAQMAINPNLYVSLPYDPIKDFKPVILLAEAPMVLLANPDTGFETLADVVEYGKANPGKLSFASSGIGSSPHLIFEMLTAAADFKAEHIPYQGGGKVYPDLLAGRVPLYFATVSSSREHIKEGRLRAIAISTKAPTDALPDVPTVAETYPDFNASVWYTIMVPAATPDPIVNKLYELVKEAFRAPELAEPLATDAVRIITDPPAEAAKFIESEIKAYKAVVESSGAKVE
jgi:tripartite-type tricarboxylate transporter receptor subunit TctC